MTAVDSASEVSAALVPRSAELAADIYRLIVKQIPALPQPTVPAPVADLPSVGDVTAVSFDFAEKVLAQQRATTDKLIAALTPAL